MMAGLNQLTLGQELSKKDSPQSCPMFSCTNDSLCLPSAAREPFKHHTVDATSVFLMETASQDDVVVEKEMGDNNAVRYLLTNLLPVVVSMRFQYISKEMVH